MEPVDAEPEIEARWKVVENAYSESSAHDEFIIACERLGRLDLAAARYRAVLATRPGDAIAIKMLRRISVASHLLPSSGPGGARAPKVGAALLALSCLPPIGAAAWLVRATFKRTDPGKDLFLGVSELLNVFFVMAAAALAAVAVAALNDALKIWRGDARAAARIRRLATVGAIACALSLAQWQRPMSILLSGYLVTLGVLAVALLPARSPSAKSPGAR